MGAKIFDALMMRPIGWIAYFSLLLGLGSLFGAAFMGESESLAWALMWALGLGLGLVIGFILGARRMRAFMLRSADPVLVHGDPERFPAPRLLTDGAGGSRIPHDATADTPDKLRLI